MVGTACVVAVISTLIPSEADHIDNWPCRIGQLIGEENEKTTINQ